MTATVNGRAEVWPTAEGEVRWTTCRGCGDLVYLARLADNLGVCPGCQHHGPLGIGDRLATLLDTDSFAPLPVRVGVRDPLAFTDTAPYVERQEQARRRTGRDEALLVGTGTVDQMPVVVAALDFAFMGGSMGTAVGALFEAAADEALRTRRPLVMVAASGGARMQEGCLSLMQLAVTAQAVGRLREAGIPTVNLNVHPTYGGVTASFAMLGDVIIAEPGAMIGFAGPNVIRNTIRQELPDGFQSAEFLLEHGMIDMIVPRDELHHRLGRVLRCLVGGGLEPDAEDTAPAAVPVRTAAAPEPAALVRLARDLARPTVDEYAAALFDDFVVLAGDRCFADDTALLGGLGRIGERGVVFLGHQKAHQTTAMALTNYGMPRPEGYRKAVRLMRLAERLGLPVVTFVDTPGAYPGIEAEERGQGTAIAECLLTSARLRVPVIAVVTGEGGSGGALALAVADRVLMAENAYYSVISPEGCATILFGGAEHASRAAGLLRLTAPELRELGVVDEVVPEPEGGAHRDPAAATELVAGRLRAGLRSMAGRAPDELVRERAERFSRFTTPRED